MESSTFVECPKCHHKFLVEEVLFKKIEQDVLSKYEKDNAKKEEEFKKRLEFLTKEKAQIELEKQHSKELIEKGVKDGLLIQAEALKKEIHKDLDSKYEGKIKSLESINNDSLKKISELNTVLIENEKLKRSLETQRNEIALEFEKQFSAQLIEEAKKIKQAELNNNELKLKEKDILIDSLGEKLKDAQRKIEQGSMQRQGEAQEIKIEETLKALYPFDVVNEIGKGQKGADVLQEVRNHYGIICGKLYYESKRTKDFGKDWIEKLKNDNLEVKADICIIVTQAMPDGIETIGIKDGVWICSYTYFKELSFILRQHLINLNSIIQSQTNKGDKINMLYEYLISNEFKMQLETMIDGFISMQKSHNDEKIRMNKLWKEREKHLERVLLNITGFYGSIKGIAGNAIPDIASLEDPNIGLLDSIEN